jgi:hypothetical protein
VLPTALSLRGSSVTGVSFRTGAPFSPASDIDFYVESQQLTSGLRTSANMEFPGSSGQIVRDYAASRPELASSKLMGDWFPAAEWRRFAL